MTEMRSAERLGRAPRLEHLPADLTQHVLSGLFDARSICRASQVTRPATSARPQESRAPRRAARPTPI